MANANTNFANMQLFIGPYEKQKIVLFLELRFKFTKDFQWKVYD